mgnify:FL=1
MGDFKAVLVDDEENVRYLLADLLESFHLGIEVTGQAGDGEEALKLCRSLKPDLVISDIKMPGLDGIHMLEAVKKVSPEIICVFVSAYTDFEYAKAAIANGARGYILKPVEPEEMYQLLKTVKAEWMQSQKHRKKVQLMETEIRKLKAEHLTDDMPVDSNGCSRVIRKALNYMEDHYHEDISLESISEVVFLNKNYFSELFKKETGKSFVQYLTEYRLEKAKLLLAISGFKRSEVADMTGFQNNSYFISVFKKYVGCTPKEYSESLHQAEKEDK